MSDLEARAVELFPAWSEQQRKKWITAVNCAVKLEQRYGKLMPMTLAELRSIPQFAARTRKEAGLD